MRLSTFRLLLVALLVSFGLPAGASAYVYWANHDSGAIGRAGLTGAAQNQAFIAGASAPNGVAVNGSYVFWANEDTNTIGRANLDGSGVNQAFISGAAAPDGVAASSTHVYWTNNDGTIGRAKVDGSEVDQRFISGASGPRGLAVDATHIYWSNFNASTIGRANIDGSGANNSFITGTGTQPRGIAIDASHIYWAIWNGGYGNAIGRAGLDGTDVNKTFATAANPYAVAVDGSYVYWTNYLQYNTIGRATLDGGQVNQSFITGAFRPAGIAVDALAPDTTAPVQALSGKTAQKVGGSIAVGVTCTSEPCTVAASGTIKGAGKTIKLAKVTKALAVGAKATLRLKLSSSAQRAIAKALGKRKTVTARIKVVATDAAGNRATANRTIKLLR